MEKLEELEREINGRPIGDITEWEDDFKWLIESVKQLQDENEWLKKENDKNITYPVGKSLDITELEQKLHQKEEEIEYLERLIGLYDSALEEDGKTKERYVGEISELISLCLWSSRRLSHETHKEFAYSELEEITGRKYDRD